MVNKTPVKDETSVELEEAIDIMGENKVICFQTIKDLFNFSPEEFSKISELLYGLDLNRIPHSAETLKRFKETHFLVFVLPIPINEIKRCHPQRFSDSGSYYKLPFAKEEGELGWMLVRRIAFKDDAEMKICMEGDEEIIKSQPFVFAAALNFLVNKEAIFVGMKVRTADPYFDKKKYKDMSEQQVLVGFNDKGNLTIDWFASGIITNATVVKQNR